jgi:hypothetical protein
MSYTSLTDTQLQALVNNLTTRVSKAPFLVAGKSFSAVAVVALAKSVLTARSAALAAKGEWKNARTSDTTLEAGALPTLIAVRAMLVPMLSNDTSALSDLAVSPRKVPRALTPEERMVATEKNRATRLARGTMSKQAKSKVKGNVTGVVITPVTIPAPAATVGSSVAPSATSASTPAASSATSPPAAASIAVTNGAPVTSSGH